MKIMTGELLYLVIGNLTVHWESVY